MKGLSLTTAVLLSAVPLAFATPKPHWVAYKSNLLNLQISVPSDWKPTKIPKALAFHYDDLTGGTASIGILKSAQITDIDDAADKELKINGHPEDWARSSASIAGNRAIKITGTDAKDSSKRFVHYYIETSNGVYIVQCLGTSDRWSIYSPVFTAMLTKLKFL
jgi:hypothetical protein